MHVQFCVQLGHWCLQMTIMFNKLPSELADTHFGLRRR